jgi:hypothetical protein
VVANPCTIYFWKTRKMIRTGRRLRVPMAKMADQSVEVCGSLNILSAKETVKSFGLFKKSNGPRKSSHLQ